VQILTKKKLSLGVVLTVLAICAGALFIRYKSTESSYVAIDFPSFYYAAKLTFEDGLTPYHSSNWKIAKSEYTEGELFPFLYPPPSLFLFKPFLLFDYQSAKLLMLWLNHLLLPVFAYLFFVKLLDREPSDPYLIAGIIYLYLFFPIIINFNSGQVSLWVLIGICLSWWAAKQKLHPIWVALPLVFAIVLKLYPLLFLAIFLIRREYKVLAYISGLLILVSLCATVLLPQGIWRDWYSSVVIAGFDREVNGVMLASPSNQSVHGFTARLFYGRNQRFERLLRPPTWADQAPYLASGAIIAAALAATWRIERRNLSLADRLSLEFCIWLLVMFLVAPLSWDYHLVQILPAIIIGVIYAARGKNKIVTLLAGSAAFFLAINFHSNSPAFRNGIWTLLISSQLAAVGLLFLVFIYLAFRETNIQLRQNSQTLAA
jgi:alpha-1,2-mannosyltransferase